MVGSSLSRLSDWLVTHLPGPGGIEGSLAESERRSLSLFAVRALPEVCKAQGPRWNWHHRLICDHLQAVSEGRIRGLVLCIPPDHGTSTLVSLLWPAWHWLWHPEARQLTGAHDLRDSELHLVRTRRLLDSRWYRWRYRAVLAPAGPSRLELSTPQGGRRWAFGMGGANCGRRADLVVLDRPMRVADRSNAAVKRLVAEAFDSRLMTWLSDPRSQGWVVATPRLARDDLPGRLMLREGVVTLALPAEFDPSRRAETSFGRDPRVEPGESLWPHLAGTETLATIFDGLGRELYNAMYLQEPVD